MADEDKDRQPRVIDDVEDSRFTVTEGGDVAELVYDVNDGRLFLLHTGVPEAFRGQGIGGLLVRASVDKARAENLTIVPWCPYARRWLRDNASIADTVTIDWKTPPP